MNQKKINGAKLILERLENYSKNQNGSTSFVNNFSFLRLIDEDDEIIKSIDHWHVDGWLMVKLVNLFSSSNKIVRSSFDFTSIGKEILINANKKQLKVAFIGTEQIYLDSFLEHIRNKYSNLEIIFSRNGFFSSKKEMDDLAHNFKKAKPDLIIIGMGTPFQERLISRLKKNEIEGRIFTCGGFFHQTAKSGVQYYPEIFNRLNLRWLYRILDEPKLFLRYAVFYPYSMIILIYVFIFKK